MPNKLAFVLLAWVLFGCARKPLSTDDLRSFLRDPENGVYHQQDRGAYHLSIQYVPVDLLAERELRGVVHAPARDSIMAQYSGQLHFLLEIAKNGQDLANAWIIERGRGAEGPDLFSYGLKDHLLLDACGQQYPALQCAYMRFFEIARASSFLLSFHEPEENCGSISIKLGGVLADLGPVSFQQSINALRNVPELE